MEYVVYLNDLVPLIIQHLFSALFTNKHALMRYLYRYNKIKIYIDKYVDKIQQLGIYNRVKGNLKFNYNSSI